MSAGESRNGGKKPGRILWWTLLVAGLAAAIPLQRQIAAQRGYFAPIEEALYLPSGTLLRRMSLGNAGLLADIYWTRAVQYYGRKQLDRDVRYDLLGPLLFVTTELDPHLLIAYRFGAIFLASKPPEGAGEPREALQLLRRGIAANPDYWRLWQDLGFVYYWDMKDYKGAVKAFETGSKRPGAAIWMKTAAAMVAAKGGESETSKLLWTEVYREAANSQVRRSAAEHLLALQAAEDMRALDRLLEDYRAKTGHPAQRLSGLVAAGLLRGIPVDPTGAPYVVDPRGRAALGPKSQIKAYMLE
jgi:tetratricopeptide (TPR) repeat protein